MQYKTWTELNQMLNISEEYKAKFRPHNDVENKYLKDSLLYHKRIITPLVIQLTMSGYTLLDGHHRYSLLPEVIEECPDFDINIPVIQVDYKDAHTVMLNDQLGRRNLSNEDITQYVDVLRQEGMKKGEAIKQASKDLDLSHNQVKNVIYPDRAEKDRERKSLRNSARKLPQTTETSFPTQRSEVALEEKQTSTRKVIKGPVESSHSFEGTTAFVQRDTPITPDIPDIPITQQEIESRYKIHSDGTEEYTALRSSSELERLMNIEDTINELKGNLSFFQDYPIYDPLSTLVSYYDGRVKELNTPP